MLNQSIFAVLLWFIVPSGVHAQNVPSLSKAELDAFLLSIRNDIKDIKQDEKLIRQELSQKIDGMRSEISGLRSDMRSEISGLRSDMRENFESNRKEIATVGGRIDSAYGWIISGVWAIVVLLLGVIITQWRARPKKPVEQQAPSLAETSEETRESLSEIKSKLEEIIAYQDSDHDINKHLLALKEEAE